MPGQFSFTHRSKITADLESVHFDLLVAGGGVTGAGILLDAVSRGMTAGLVEMQDFAEGTSSRSTKLVHGGLRYLKQFEVDLVAEVGQERAIVYENAPHVTTPLWMLLPIVQRGTYGMFMSSVGIYLYDRLAEVKESERRVMLNRKQALEAEPLLRTDTLQGAGRYVEYRTDDARLTLEIMKEAVERGGIALNYMRVDELVYDKGVVTGAMATDLITGKTIKITARKVVNATGAWVDELRAKDKSKVGKTLHLTKGVHIVVDGSRFPLRNPVYFDVPDGRMIFGIPREGKVYIGTTDTDYKGNPAALRTTKQDVDYLLRCVNQMFPSLQLTVQDIESFWAGVRPLIHEEGKAPSEISRRDEVFISPTGLITIAGGKLTGYRKMAEKIVSLVASELREDLGKSYPDCFTDKIELSGGKFGGSANMPAYISKQVDAGVALGLATEEALKLAERYGTNVGVLYDILKNKEKEAADSGLSPEVFGALMYGIEHEMVVTPTDFFVRRTGAMFFHVDWVRQWKDPVVKYMSKFFQWSVEETDKYRKELEHELVVATETVPDDGN